MSRFPFFVLVLPMLAMLMAGCDFPAEPPRKPTPITPPDPPVVMLIDSAKSLLPLTAGNRYTYLVVPKSGQPPQDYLCIVREITYKAGTFHLLDYTTKDGPGPQESIFPPLLQTDSTGLSFYQIPSGVDTLGNLKPPPFKFKLPYPAPLNTQKQFGNIVITVIGKDSLAYMRESTNGFRTYIYEIQESLRDKYTMVVIPGKAILRIDLPRSTVYTTGWRLE